MGQLINLAGIEVSKNLDKYIKAREPQYEEGRIERTLRESKKMTGRLLHYFPQQKKDFDPNVKWCGWHNDHGTLTGLCSAIYLDKDGNEMARDLIEDEKSGLFAMNRDHEVVKIRIPQDSLAF